MCLKSTILWWESWSLIKVISTTKRYVPHFVVVVVVLGRIQLSSPSSGLEKRFLYSCHVYSSPIKILGKKILEVREPGKPSGSMQPLSQGFMEGVCHSLQ